ncbi:Aspartyl-tRNA(Asn) amidotransferase subunit A Glutamyl-tRNA(Gln) amidotransferase subunit A [Candidatus Burkholderia verschuerenii]|uniref:Aspartyl-tRNA(Asn) amidotransferase subunit A Glutamyl-tRNA(Gln) amidotransferase subunit A n=1 Tax=Candidatus Burkholderia verschuerenii TaxID=242163 RepID=A0A0L0MEC1_9BURK|nr:amidase [Candidatus Burkholderia verschuerenii]KND60605.1 Aspartyl-tRNA(Asn) amidotransferase subunit A Glutamyl-tRNA(Gln) amidotransferase subunit A [Candidatus Burkholderia verschuerenii]
MTQGSAMDIDLDALTVEAVQAAFKAGTYTAEQLARACFDRIERDNAKYNALIFLNPDALDDARTIDARRAAGESLGPLAGVPVVIKDPMDMVGFPTTAGWAKLYSKRGGVDLMPERDAPVVARMRRAGAILLGKTNVPILSHTGSHANDSWAEPTINVPMPDRVPGGSSADTASAVASGMAVLGLAEETGGSIQNPALAQDLVGIKPTIGLVPNAGVVPLSGNRDVVGPIARNVRDAALCLDVLAGYTSEDTKTLASVGHQPAGGYTSALAADALSGKRIGLYGAGWRTQPLSDEAAALYERVKRELTDLGAVLIDDPFKDSGFAGLRKVTPPLEHFDARGLESIPYDLEKYLQRLGKDAALKTFAEFAEATQDDDQFGPDGVLRYLHNLADFRTALANPSLPPEMPEFVDVKARYLTIFDAVMSEHRLDALIFPQMRCELPPLHGTDIIQETTVGEINIAGLPGIAVPAGYYASGSPFGLIFVGRQWDEAALLGYAYAYEVSRSRS